MYFYFTQRGGWNLCLSTLKLLQKGILNLMPPAKVWIFVGRIGFIFLVGFLVFGVPENTKQIPCETGLHIHGDGPEHCDP